MQYETAAHKEKGLPFLGRQPLVVQLLTGGWRKANRYRVKHITGRAA
jgi:hypothetical protein